MAKSDEDHATMKSRNGLDMFKLSNPRQDVDLTSNVRDYLTSLLPHVGAIKRGGDAIFA